MPTDEHHKNEIHRALMDLDSGDLRSGATALFHALGYNSDKTLDLTPNTADEFRRTFDGARALNEDRALARNWKSVDVVFQLTVDDVAESEQGRLAFAEAKQLNPTLYESYLFIAIELGPTAESNPRYARTQLANITREVNKLFAMPVMVLFRHGDALSFAVINRRPHKRDEAKDVLEKVTLIKDISTKNPHRAHVEILSDLSLAALRRGRALRSFADVHEAWQAVLDSSELNKRFFKEVANWYFWAAKRVAFPADAEPDKAKRNATSVIRLITRLIFVWFIKEKGLVPDDLFDRAKLDALVNFGKPSETVFYKTILQNLFFATLNTEMGQRDFRKKSQTGGRDQHHMVHNLYRYEHLMRQPDAVRRLFEGIPFLNGGLFECLDRVEGDRDVRVDGFSDRADSVLRVPDELFFADEHDVDLNDDYGTENKKYKARGLIRIFGRYKFTIEENTPLEEEIALDPELLGKVFENLLAAYNPETGTTARKQTGSFYTPREIVNYMVDESLIAYLQNQLGPASEVGSDALRHLFAYGPEPHRFADAQAQALIEAIDRAKILDPACGSGAFPMGILHRLVHLLGKLDPDNARWKELQRRRAVDASAEAFDEDDSAERKARLNDINEAFENNTSDYGRKLYLIENCIYGVDIQPIAGQIAKLRFFISLVVDQTLDPAKPNLGIRPLPNLETKFVAANTLIGIARPQQMALRDPQVDQLESQLRDTRHRHFAARTPATKAKYRQQDKRLRKMLADVLQRSGMGKDEAVKLAGWNPYDQNASAGFFDPEWMFGLADGFDVVIGNPPYVRQEQIKDLKPLLQNQYECYTGTADLYVYFYERAMQLLAIDGVLAYISSNKYFRAGYGEKLRDHLSKQATIRVLIDFGDAPVFTAIAYPSIIVLQKIRPSANDMRILVWQPAAPVSDFVEIWQHDSFFMPQRELTRETWKLESSAVLRLLEKLRAAGTPLGEYVNGRLYFGIKTGLNEAFVVDRQTRDALIEQHPSSADLLKPFLRGRDVKRWTVQFAEQYLIKIESSENVRHAWSGKRDAEAERIFAARFPAVHAHLNQFRKQLIVRDDQGKYFWELRSCTYWKEFEGVKLIYPNICQQNEFAWDEGRFLANQKAYIVPVVSKYLLAVLNSSVTMWLFRQMLAKLQGNFFEPSKLFMEKIPIVEANGEQQAPVIALVDRILAAKRANPHADVSELEAEIDRLVYALYGLTDDEIKIVDE